MGTKVKTQKNVEKVQGAYTFTATLSDGRRIKSERYTSEKVARRVMDILKSFGYKISNMVEVE
jgi:hypothetical protein